MQEDWPPLDQIERIARWAAARSPGRPLSRQDRIEAAYDGMIDHIATGGPLADLPIAGLNEIRRAQAREARLHGAPDQRYAGGGHGWATYWEIRPAEDDAYTRVEDRIALGQVMAGLGDLDRATLQVHVDAAGNTKVAASLADTNPSTYKVRLHAARRRAQALWFAPQRPPARQWARDGVTVDKRRALRDALGRRGRLPRSRRVNTSL